MTKYIALLISIAAILLVPVAHAQEISFPKLLYQNCESRYNDLQSAIAEADDAERDNASYDLVTEAEDDYEDCHAEEQEQFEVLVERGNNAIEQEDYEKALPLFQDARVLVLDPEGVDTVITDLYIALAQQAYQEGNYNDMERYLASADDLEPDTRDKYLINYFSTLYAIQRFDRKEAERLGARAKAYAKSREEIEQVASLQLYIKERISSPSTDQLSRKQFRLNHLGIDKARTALPSPTNIKEVVVAIIDSGIDTDHPDLKGQIRTNTKEKANNGKDDDNNGYIDDLHGYDFVSNSPDTGISDGHGTLVAGVIGALQNNQLWISGILPRVKLMSVVACKDEACLPGSKLAEAIIYAIDNGADVINMSISSASTSTAMHPDLTAAIQRANNKNVIVVVAGWNGKKISDTEKVALDTDISLVLPVCNEPVSHKQIIGVGAVDKDNNRISRSNKGKCIDVMAYGQDIVSTSFFVTSTGSYGVAEGTSLASPMIAWIVGLGHSLYGTQHRKIVYDALLASTTADKIPQADLYLAELQQRILPARKRTEITTIASTIYDLINTASSWRKFQYMVTLKDFFSTYEQTLSASEQYQKLSILYYLEQELRKYELFKDL